jgi:hypothetical protein
MQASVLLGGVRRVGNSTLCCRDGVHVITGERLQQIGVCKNKKTTLTL